MLLFRTETLILRCQADPKFKYNSKAFDPKKESSAEWHQTDRQSFFNVGKAECYLLGCSWLLKKN